MATRAKVGARELRLIWIFEYFNWAGVTRDCIKYNSLVPFVRFLRQIVFHHVSRTGELRAALRRTIKYFDK